MDVSKSHRSPSSDRLSPQQRNHNRQSFSTSTSSLLAGSPRRSSRSRSPVAHAPVPSVSTDFGRGASRGSIEQRTTPQPPASAPLPVPSQPHPQAAVSPAAQSTSLGRATASSPPRPVGLRRNSLGDLKTPLTTGEHKPQLPTLGELKIPARISRAQQGLRRDLGMVKEFAACVERE
ncbi:hypothetical protein K439DRAFT_1344916 [Ramaria rubella]|nr:hypothetical protein K439DRAFT_1344916 [Ramaria rubella]